MSTATTLRKQTSFRLSTDLIARLQEEAKRHNRSLNNLVESVLLAFVAERPNKTTLAAIEEARSGKLHDMAPIDTSSVEAMFKSME